MGKVHDLRQREWRQLAFHKYIDAIFVYLWASAPIAIALAIFITYTLLGNELTAAKVSNFALFPQNKCLFKVFTSLALVNMLIMPLNAFPWTLIGIVEAYVSIKRLNAFCALPEMDKEAMYDVTKQGCFLSNQQ